MKNLDRLCQLDGVITNRTIRKRFDSALRIWITMGCGSSILSIQQMLRKYRRHRLRLLRKKEYNRLRAMVPSIATRPKVSKVTVIEEAIKYIDQLHVALISRLQTRGFSKKLKGFGFPTDIEQISHSQLRELVLQMLPASSNQLRPIGSTPNCRRSSSSSSSSSTLETSLLWELALQEQRGKWRSP